MKNSLDFVNVERNRLENKTRSTLWKSRSIGLKANLVRLSKSRGETLKIKPFDFIKVERHKIENKTRSTL